MQFSVAAVISAAGSSSRMGGVKKEYLPLEGTTLTVLGAVVTAFASSGRIGPIVITVPPDQEESESAARASLPAALLQQDRIFFIPGGHTRRASVYNALSFLESCHPSYVLIHDGARPWIKPQLIERVIDAAIKYEAVIPVLPLAETPKELCDSREYIKQHLRRAEIVTAQTPQGFKFPEILKAHEEARLKLEKSEQKNKDGKKFEYTDDAEVWGEFAGNSSFRRQVAVIPGDPENRKITYPEDIILQPRFFVKPRFAEKNSKIIGEELTKWLG